jgi:hypothetical protein
VESLNSFGRIWEEKNFVKIAGVDILVIKV